MCDASCRQMTRATATNALRALRSCPGIDVTPNWLFRDNGNGSYTALVDVFMFWSGSTPAAATLPDGTTPLGEGTFTQPVPVLFQ